MGQTKPISTDRSLGSAESGPTNYHPYPSSDRMHRFNAWFFDVFDGFIDWSLRRVKGRVYADLPMEVVEIGPGVGANFRYYRRGTRVIAFEPNTRMHPALEERAADLGIELDLRAGLAESTGLESSSVEVVVSNLVLCTVNHPSVAVEEIHRILRPGGRLVFVEHVAARGHMLHLLQRAVARPWAWLFEGCELDRDTTALLADAGFQIDDVTERTVPTLFVPVNSMAYGSVTK